MLDKSDSLRTTMKVTVVWFKVRGSLVRVRVRVGPGLGPEEHFMESECSLGKSG
jgi:hypothetical protein